MDVIKLNTKTNEAVFCKYPRNDEEPVSGLDPNIRYYKIQRDDKPDFNPLFQFLREDRNYIEGDPLGLCEISFIIEQREAETIINRLNESLGDYLDNNYPIWQRIKHINELIDLMSDDSPEAVQRIEYINALNQWLTDCRSDRDSMEEAFLNDNILPSLTWKNIPTK